MQMSHDNKYISTGDFVQLLQDIKNNSDVSSQLALINRYYPFMSQLLDLIYVQLRNQSFDINDAADIDLHNLHFYLRMAALENNLNLKTIVKALNAVLPYTGYDYSSIRSYHPQIDMSQPVSYADCKSMQSANRFVSTTQYNVDNIMLRHYLYQQQLSEHVADANVIDDEPIFHPYVMYRKLSWLDFNEEILKHLSIETLIAICTQHDLVESASNAEDVLLEKCMQIDKLYIIDVDLDKATIAQLTAKINQHNASVQVPLDLLVWLRDVQTQVNSQSFNEKLRTLIGVLVEEHECVLFLMELCHHVTQSSGVQNSYVQDKIVEIANMTQLKRCLLKQVFTSVVNDQSHPTYNTHLKTLSQHLLQSIPDSCVFYIDETMGLPQCRHQSFHYYTLNKWMYLFCQLFSVQFPNALCDHATISSKANLNIIYPRKGFCSGCYAQYKQMQQINVGPLNNASLRFVVMLWKNQLYSYRVRFSNMCDIKPTASHFIEAKNALNSLDSMTREAIVALHNELRNMRILFLNG